MDLKVLNYSHLRANPQLRTSGPSSSHDLIATPSAVRFCPHSLRSSSALANCSEAGARHSSQTPLVTRRDEFDIIYMNLNSIHPS